MGLLLSFALSSGWRGLACVFGWGSFGWLGVGWFSFASGWCFVFAHCPLSFEARLNDFIIKLTPAEFKQSQSKKYAR
jgi:hypothetical protein